MINKEVIKGLFGYIVLMVSLSLAIWGAGKLFADVVSDEKVIIPEPGVHCLVVSRMFNTSTDCWKVEE